MDRTVTIPQPKRWDNPFDVAMGQDVPARILAVEPFCRFDAGSFPLSVNLENLVRNDMRLRIFRRGDVVVRQGDYGSSAFVTLEGKLRVITDAGLSPDQLGRRFVRKKTWWEVFKQFWAYPAFPEVRQEQAGALAVSPSSAQSTQIDVDLVLADHTTIQLQEGQLFGEIAALGRTPRNATIVAETEVELVEIRWQGLRDLMRYAPWFREKIEALYRERSLITHLQQTPIFSHLAAGEIAHIANGAIFESYGDFEWQSHYKAQAGQDHHLRLQQEPVIVREGDYLDGLLLVRAGFARVSTRVNHGTRTLAVLSSGDIFGYQELVENWCEDRSQPYRYSLRAMGYVDIVRVPTSVIESKILPFLPKNKLCSICKTDVPSKSSVNHSRLSDGMVEFLVSERFFNGSAAMVIDLERCTRCDDCLRACAMTHRSNPRFIRNGPHFENYMVTHACMHCKDPVCMIGCPTGAIHRGQVGGEVVINDLSCIGCGTCAQNCPYENIRMVPVRDEQGHMLYSQETGMPILTATKCDLCSDQPAGPACRNACPQDALVRIDPQNFKALETWMAR